MNIAPEKHLEKKMYRSIWYAVMCLANLQGAYCGTTRWWLWTCNAVAFSCTLILLTRDAWCWGGKKWKDKL